MRDLGALHASCFFCPHPIELRRGRLGDTLGGGELLAKRLDLAGLVREELLLLLGALLAFHAALERFELLQLRLGAEEALDELLRVAFEALYFDVAGIALLGGHGGRLVAGLAGGLGRSGRFAAQRFQGRLRG